jgi:hypothetical protein
LVLAAESWSCWVVRLLGLRQLGFGAAQIGWLGTRAQLGQVSLGLLGRGDDTIGRCHTAASLAELGLGRAQLGLGGGNLFRRRAG